MLVHVPGGLFKIITTKTLSRSYFIDSPVCKKTVACLSEYFSLVHWKMQHIKETALDFTLCCHFHRALAVSAVFCCACCWLYCGFPVHAAKK